MDGKAQTDLEKEKLNLKVEILQKEWKECRETVRNFDTTLSWHRLYSVIVVLALLGIATDVFIEGNALPAIITTLVTLPFIVVVFFLERHYRGFMHITVKRARRLEKGLKDVYKKLGVDLEKITIHIDCEETSAMISEVITKKRDTYNWFKKEAHTLIYVFLFVICFCILCYFIYSFSTI